MMYSKFQFLLLVTMFLWTASLWGQNTPVGIGYWRSHLAYENMVALTESKDAVFFASTQAILKVNKEDQSLEHINKVSGLSDMQVKTLEYHLEEDILIIAYNNGNIDLLYKDGSVTNLSAILNNNNIIGNKSINHIFYQGKKIYFSCAFGLVVYDLELAAFSQTTFSPININACSQLDNALFIATDQGIYKGVLDGRNLLDFGVWEYQGAAEGLSSSYVCRNLVHFNDKIYAAIDDSLFLYNGQWGVITAYDKENNQMITGWRPSAGGQDFVPFFNMALSYDKTKLIVATNTPIYYLISTTDTIETAYYHRSWRVKDIVIDQENIHWAADEAFIHRNFQHIEPNAPDRNQVSDMHVDQDGVLWVTSSAYNGIVAYFDKSGFYQYKEGEWKTFNASTQPAMDTFWDAIKVIHNPENNKLYVSSFMSGLLEMDANESIETFDQYDSDVPLEGTNGDNARTRVEGLTVDDDGNVWMTNTGTPGSTLTVKRLNGTWKAFPSVYFNNKNLVSNVAVDKNGYKWVQHVAGNVSVTVFDSGDLDDDTDNRYIQLGSHNTDLPNNEVQCLVADKKGTIWIGTTEGITIFHCSASVFDGECGGNRPVITQDEFNGHLLEGEIVKDIVVDGANRKWVATANGLFFLSADGKSQLAYFTKENSPLFDNDILHLAIDGVTGTLYIATLNGIQSYRGEATTGLRKMKTENIEVFPHPVQPDYRGPIAISNLADEANVKITDASGRLVYETTALGGQAIWSGTDYNGRRAQSGVYFVFIVNEEGTQKGVGKILFLN